MSRNFKCKMSPNFKDIWAQLSGAIFKEPVVNKWVLGKLGPGAKLSGAHLSTTNKLAKLGDSPNLKL